MKCLVIDSHKSGDNGEQQNLHWINARIISDYLNADFIWSYPHVNDNIKGYYDSVIFNHASKYSFESEQWLYSSPTAKFYYVCNDYNLGEAITLWKWAKTNGRTFEVIANHDKTSNINLTKCYVSKWYNVNLNSLIFDVFEQPEDDFFGVSTKSNCIYYGTFRKRRAEGFKTYLKSKIVLSTHESNQSNFRNLGCTSPRTNRIVWHPKGIGLSNFKFSLCIEDEITYTNYSRLPNRFYEALNYNVIPMFDVKSKQNIEKSGYNIPDCCYVNSYENLLEQMKKIESMDMSGYMQEWRNMAQSEKDFALQEIKNIVTQ